jgi:hypothetical protein
MGGPAETRGDWGNPGEKRGKRLGKGGIKVFFSGSYPYFIIIIHENWRNCGDLTQLVFKRM